MVIAAMKLKHLLLRRKAMTNQTAYWKAETLTLATKFCLISYGFSSSHVCMWEYVKRIREKTVKKAEHLRIDAFEQWCWRRHLRVPWTARRCTQSILREISPEYSLEGLMLKLKLQYFSHLMGRTDSLEKSLMLGKIEDRRWRGRRGWNGCMASPTWWTWVWASS